MRDKKCEMRDKNARWEIKSEMRDKKCEMRDKNARCEIKMRYVR